MTDTIEYLRRCGANRVLEASLTPAQCRKIVQMHDDLQIEREAVRVLRDAKIEQIGLRRQAAERERDELRTANGALHDHVNDWRKKAIEMRNERDTALAELERARDAALAVRSAAAALARRRPLYDGASGESAEDELAQAIEDLPPHVSIAANGE